jgi:hypothetical protein
MSEYDKRSPSSEPSFGENSQSWMARVRNISIELHGPDCEETFFRALSDYNYDLSRAYDLTFCLHLIPKPKAAMV